MSNQERRDNKRLSWKQAFHLLKCVALRKFKLKHLDDSMFFTHQSHEAIKSEVKDSSKNEKIIYARPKPITSKLLSILTKNQSFNFENSTVNSNINLASNIDSDNLAKTIVLNIINEIKTRSNSSTGSKDSKLAISSVSKITSPYDQEINIPSISDRNSDSFRSDLSNISNLSSYQEEYVKQEDDGELDDNDKMLDESCDDEVNENKEPFKQSFITNEPGKDSPILSSTAKRVSFSKFEKITSINKKQNQLIKQNEFKRHSIQVSIQNDEKKEKISPIIVRKPRYSIATSTLSKRENKLDKLKDSFKRNKIKHNDKETDKIKVSSKTNDKKNEIKKQEMIQENNKIEQDNAKSSKHLDKINDQIEKPDENKVKETKKVAIKALEIPENKESSIKQSINKEFDKVKPILKKNNSSLKLNDSQNVSNKDDQSTVSDKNQQNIPDNIPNGQKPENIDKTHADNVHNFINKLIYNALEKEKLNNAEINEMSEKMDDSYELIKMDSDKINESETQANVVVQSDSELLPIVKPIMQPILFSKSSEQNLPLEKTNQNIIEHEHKNDIKYISNSESLNTYEPVATNNSSAFIKDDESSNNNNNNQEEYNNIVTILADNKDYFESSFRLDHKMSDKDKINTDEKTITDQEATTNASDTKNSEKVSDMIDKEEQKIEKIINEPEATTNANDAENLNAVPDTVVDNNQTIQDLNQTELDEVINDAETNLEEQAPASTTGQIEEQEERPITSTKKKRLDEKPKMDASFFYDYESLIFQPVITEEAPFKTDFIQLYHSFGYDCKKRANLNILDPETLIFSAGNLVVILNIKTKEQKYLKTLGGGAVGAIAVHPSHNYFAIGEKGNMPNINIFEYPSLKLYRILRKGTQKGYAFMDFDPPGNLLASLGSAPDFMLTIWDWKEENVVLRTKAFSQDVYKVTFSKDLKGILTSAGSGHIRFWKMANTFTGYKLQGDLGKFGKTEISDIEGYAELPDGKVLSGSEWGNMLLWDGGLIQTEICRKKNKPCHSGTIQQITLNEGDIYTIGDDGSIRVWDFETIDTAEPSEEGVKLEIEPLNELKVGNNVALRSMVKDFSEESTIWYAQDSHGGIWKLDLSFSASSENPRQLFNFHAGTINGIESCSNSHLFATTADDGSVKIYNYATFELLTQKKFKKGGTSLKWFSTEVDPDGATIAAGFSDGVLRFMKIVLKQTQTAAHTEQHYELVIFEAFKPHTKAITRIAIDSKNSIIATGSDDQTIFFFSNSKNTRTPIGFVNLPSPVTYMTWTPADYAKNRLLVCMQNGMVFEFDAPVLGNYDTSKTYLIDRLKFRSYTFKSIKSRLRHEEELERKRQEEEARKKKLAEERRLRGIEDDEKKKNDEKKEDEQKEKEKTKDEEQAEETAKKEDEWKPYIPEVPSKIFWAYYSSQDTFWLSMDDYDAGYLYECKFLEDAQKARMAPDKIDEPFKAVPVVGSDLNNAEDIPLTCIIFNKQNTYSVVGEKNGVVRVQEMPANKSIQDIKHYLSYTFHDNEYGHITHMCYSYDEKFLFSVGSDSNIFGILFNSSIDELNKARTEKINITNKIQVNEATDIDDSQAYSIEQAKQKSEKDKMIATAESKKQEMRLKINQLRKTFKDLTVKNDQLVPRLRLDRNEFMLEESIKQQVLNQISEKINLTYRELAWQSEKCRISLEKLQSRFRDVIDCDHIVLFSFDDLLTVSTFRTVALPKDMEAYKIELEKQYLAKLAEKRKNQENIENQGGFDSSRTSEIKLDGPSAADQLKKIFGKLRGNTAARVERALKKMDDRKLKRLKRKKEWNDLFNARLPDDYENPDDLAAIKYAEDNLGDFKLKSGLDFVIPENQRMNVYKAVERLMQIKDFINRNQMIFNKKILSLRDKKKELVDEINKNIDRLDQIQFLTGQPLDKQFPRVYLRSEEIPEKKYEFTKEKLLEFKKELESKQLTGNKGNDEESGGFGGFGATATKSKSIKDASIDQNKSSNPALLEGLKPLWQHEENMSALMKKTIKTKELKLLFEKNQLIKSIEDKMKLFDAELKVLRHEKARISIYMKMADLRHVTLFEEFMLLREFEKTENELELKLAKKKEEHLDMLSKLTDIQSKIDGKRKDIEKLDDNLKQLLQTYNQLTHDEIKYADFLTKVYKRKIKRKKKTDGSQEDEESEESDESDDDDDDDLDNEDDDSEAEAKEQLDLDICPSGLRQELFDQVCQLREKRLDLEDQIGEEKKLLDQLKKDQDSLIKKGKLAENSLKQAQQELENFQKEKQKKINDLDIVVIMRLSQIQFLDKGKLTADLSSALAFDSHNLDKLQVRIKDLQHEKAHEKKLFRNLKEHHQELIRDKKKMDEYVKKLDELCNKMMTDKFGKLVDIERLELIAVNQQIEELKQRLTENEFEHEKVMQDWLKKINNEKDESIELLKANTTRINEMVDILNETNRLEKKLDTKQSSLGEELAATTKKDIDERKRLHTLVQLQAQEIEALKAEISILSRKGGHILPPTQPPGINQVQTA